MTSTPHHYRDNQEYPYVVHSHVNLKTKSEYHAEMNHLRSLPHKSTSQLADQMHCVVKVVQSLPPSNSSSTLSSGGDLNNVTSSSRVPNINHEELETKGRKSVMRSSGSSLKRYFKP